MNHFKLLSPLGIVVIYILIATTWLLVSDSLIEASFDPNNPVKLIAHVSKGLFNIVWTAVLIYILTSKSQKKIRDEKSIEEVSNKRVAETFERISDSFLKVDKDWNITYINRHLESTFGESRANVIGKNLWKAIPRFTSPEIRTNLEKAVAQGIDLKFRFSNQQFERDLLFSAYPIEDGLAVYMQDVTDLVKAEEQLVDQERLLQFLLDSIEDKIWSFDRDKKYISFNRAFAQAYRGFAGKFPEVGQSTDEDFAKMKSSEAWNEAIARTLDGNESLMIDVFKEGEIHAINEVRLNPIRNKTGAVIGVLFIARDVTAKVINEQHLERQNELFDEIAWLTSHEIRGPVATIRGLLNIVNREQIVSNENAEMLEHLVECSEQLDTMIKSIIEKVEYAYSLKPMKSEDFED